MISDSSWPWKVLDLTVIDRQPTLPIEELNKFSIFLLGFLHALLQPKGFQQQVHLTLWAAAILGGIGSDIVFSYLPIVDNFFHAQATLMIYPRLPAYIVFFYVGWLYIPMAIMWRIGVNPITEASICSLLCFAYYAPWDIVGIKHLWWTWHDSDSPLQNRYLNVPFASSMFVLVQTFCWAILVRIGFRGEPQLKEEKQLSVWTVTKVCSLVAGFTVPCLFGVMGFLQSLFALSSKPPPPNWTTLFKTSMVFSFLAAAFYRRTVPFAKWTRADLLLIACLCLHFGWMLFCSCFLDSSNEISVGVHQTYGDCHEKMEDLLGSRRKYICQEFSTQDFRFRCFDSEDLPKPGSSWYSICGTAKTQAWQRETIVVIAGAVIIYMFLIAYAYFTLHYQVT